MFVQKATNYYVWIYYVENPCMKFGTKQPMNKAPCLKNTIITKDMLYMMNNSHSTRNKEFKLFTTFTIYVYPMHYSIPKANLPLIEIFYGLVTEIRFLEFQIRAKIYVHKIGGEILKLTLLCQQKCQADEAGLLSAILYSLSCHLINLGFSENNFVICMIFYH